MVDQILPVLTNDEIEIALICRLEVLPGNNDSVTLRMSRRFGLRKCGGDRVIAFRGICRIPVNSGGSGCNMETRSHPDEPRFRDVLSGLRSLRIDAPSPTSHLHPAVRYCLIGILRGLGAKCTASEKESRDRCCQNLHATSGKLK